MSVKQVGRIVNIIFTTMDKIKILETEVEELKALLISIVRKAQPSVGTFITRKEIMEIMGWNARQFKYNVQFLKPFGLIHASGYRMPYKGFMAYLDAKNEGGNGAIKKFIT